MRPESLSARFWRKVAKSEGDCWLWTGAVNSAGYGSIGLGRSTMVAHRAAWLLVHGSLPTDLCVCHTCDVRICVNPAHLFLGTNSDNVADRERKGRNVVLRGEQHGSAKLTRDQALAIKSAAGKQWDIAHAFGVSQATVQRIKAGRQWAHLPLERVS